MRKLGILIFFVIFSCVYFLHGLALEDPKASNHLTVAQENKHETNGSSNSANLHTTTSGDDEEFVEAKVHAFFPNKAQRGKGSYGGANVVHRPNPNGKSAASTLQSPSTTNFCISVFFVLILPLLRD